MSRPLLLLDGRGDIVGWEVCSRPDVSPLTEFYAGVLVPGFPAQWQEAFARMVAHGGPLDEQLARMPRDEEGVLAVVSGLDYATLRPTRASRIEPLARGRWRCGEGAGDAGGTIRPVCGKDSGNEKRDL